MVDSLQPSSCDPWMASVCLGKLQIYDTNIMRVSSSSQLENRCGRVDKAEIFLVTKDAVEVVLGYENRVIIFSLFFGSGSPGPGSHPSIDKKDHVQSTEGRCCLPSARASRNVGSS